MDAIFYQPLTKINHHAYNIEFTEFSNYKSLGSSARTITSRVDMEMAPGWIRPPFNKFV
jgi:hypothetical protein